MDPMQQTDATIARLVPVTPVVTDLLLTLIQRVPTRGLDLLAADTTLDAELREELHDVLLTDRTPEQMAIAMGDLMRARQRDLNADAIECYRAAFYLGRSWEEMAANPLYARFTANKGFQPFDKWIHYFDIYERTLRRFVGTDARVLEIGVFHGGGLDQLRFFLGEGAVLVGADVDPAARDACAGRFPVAVGDQTDPEFLDEIVAEYGPFDVIIDDGGHSMRQQITSIERLFPTLNDGGVYIVEDTHTSYWEGYQDADQTFMDWVKDRVDDVNGYHFARESELPVWTTHVAGLHVYDSVVVVDKKKRFPPFCEVAGTGSFVLNDRISESTLLTFRAALNSALVAQEGLRQRAEELGESFQERHQRVQELEAQLAARDTAEASGTLRKLKTKLTGQDG